MSTEDNSLYKWLPNNGISSNILSIGNPIGQGASLYDKWNAFNAGNVNSITLNNGQKALLDKNIAVETPTPNANLGTNIPGSNNTNKGLLDQIMSMLGIENAESFAKGAEGLGSLASIGQGIYNAMMQNKAFNLQKSAMEQAMKFNAENQARQRHEWARQDANRASISSSWNGR